MCNKVGHVASRCLSGDDAQREVKTLLSAKGNPAKTKFLKNIILCNRFVKAFIDPENSLSTIKDHVASKYGLKVMPQNDESIRFGTPPNVTETHGVVRELLTVDGLEPKVCKFLVVPDTTQNFNVVIGRNFT